MYQSQKAVVWFDEVSQIGNAELQQFIANYVELCKPDKVFVCTDSDEDIEYIRELAIKNGEESKLAIDGHTVHFDAYYDQGRDREHTNILVPEGVDLGSAISTKDRDKGLKEIHEILKDIMKGKELYIRFFLLGTDQI